MGKANVVWAILFSLSASTAVDAQGVGSLIKKKVAQAAGAQNPAPAQQAAPQGGSKLGFTLTDAVMQSLEKGMELEIELRQDYMDSLVGLKTQDEFYECEGQAQATPEGLAIQEEFVARMEKATTQADFTRVSAWMADTLKVVVTKLCGDDPGPRYAAKDDEFRKARAAATAEFLSVFQPGVAVSDFWYGLLEEWAVPFFQLSAAAQQQAAANGISIPGAGTNIFWVYTAQEAALLIAHRATLEPLLKALT